MLARSASELFANLLEIDVEYRSGAGENPASHDYVDRFPNYVEIIADVPAASMEDGHAASGHAIDSSKFGATRPTSSWDDID